MQLAMIFPATPDADPIASPIANVFVGSMVGNRCSGLTQRRVGTQQVWPATSLACVNRLKSILIVELGIRQRARFALHRCA